MHRKDQTEYIHKGAAQIPPDHVLTPGGYRHRSLVHYVPKGHHVERRGGRLRQVETASGNQVELYGRVLKSFPVPDVGTGWITYTSWSNDSGSPISRFVTQWTVPQPPEAPNSGQTVFLYNCIEDAAQNDIVQPVLQWGVSAIGGGDYWAIANWYVDQSGQVCHRDLQPVNPGDVLTGIITLTGQNGGEFSYNSSFAGYPDLDLPVSSIGELVWAAETLEAYQIGALADYPAAPQTAMSAIEIEAGPAHPPLNWVITNHVTTFNESSSVVNPANPGGEVVIFY